MMQETKARIMKIHHPVKGSSGEGSGWGRGWMAAGAAVFPFLSEIPNTIEFKALIFCSGSLHLVHSFFSHNFLFFFKYACGNDLDQSRYQLFMELYSLSSRGTHDAPAAASKFPHRLVLRILTCISKP